MDPADLLKSRRRDTRICAALVARESLLTLITSIEFAVLSIVERFGCIDKSFIHGIIPRDHSTISHTFTSLYSKGFLKEHFINRNYRYVTITPAGRAIVAEFKRQQHAIMEKLEAKTLQLLREGEQPQPPAENAQ